MDLKTVIKKAKERGWYLHRCKNHYIFKHDKGGVVVVPKTVARAKSGLETRRNFAHQEIIHNH